MMPGKASGRHAVAKVQTGPAPSVAAACSSRWSTASIDSRMAFPPMVRAIRLSIEAVDQRLEHAAATIAASPVWTFATVDVAAGAARHHRGLAAVVRAGARRVRRDHHVRFEYSRRDPNDSAAIYTFTQVPGATPLRSICHRGSHDLVCRASCLRVVRAPRRCDGARELTTLRSMWKGSSARFRRTSCFPATRRDRGILARPAPARPGSS